MEEKLLKLQGKWERVENNIIKSIKIENDKLEYENGDKETLGWRSDVNQWVITGFLVVRFLSINEEGDLVSTFRGNGFLAANIFIYKSVKI